MLWQSVLSQQSTSEAALNECLNRCRDFSGPIDLAFVFIHSSFRKEAEPIVERLWRQLKPKVLWGCTGGGVIGDSTEVETTPALSLTLAQLPGVEVCGFHLDDDELPTPDAAPDAWRKALSLPPTMGQEPSFLLLADPFDFELESFLQGLDYAYPRSLKLGGLASDARSPGGNRLFLQDQTFNRGLVGLALSGNLRLDAVVAQGCRPIGEPMTVTQGERNIILQIDGRPPLEKLEQTLKALTKRERTLAENSLFIGIRGQSDLSLQSILGGPETPGSSTYLIRNLIGLEPRKGSLVVGAAVRAGQTIQFHLRDARSSAQDLRASLEAYQQQGVRPRGGLLFSCLGRGEHLYKKSNHDSDEFRSRFPATPLGGFFANGEIGPVGQTSYIHGYTSCFAMFSPNQEATR